MLDEETKKRIADFYEDFELVELLRPGIETIIEVLEEEITERLDEIEEFIGFRKSGGMAKPEGVSDEDWDFFSGDKW